jgi:hypothetical protein
MGCAVSTRSDKMAQLRSKNIDKKLAQEQQNQKSEVKLLLLGEFLQLIPRNYIIGCPETVVFTNKLTKIPTKLKVFQNFDV